MPIIPKQRPEIGLVQPALQSIHAAQGVKIFVGGLHPATKRDQIVDLVKSSLGIVVGCFQLRTKYPTYSSFCVTTTDDYADILLCCNIWPESAKITYFNGRRKKSYNAQNTQKTNVAQERQNVQKKQSDPTSSRSVQTTMDRFVVPAVTLPNTTSDFRNVTLRKKHSWAADNSEDDQNTDLHLSESESDPAPETETEAVEEATID